MKAASFIIGVIIFVLVLTLVGNQDYQDAKRDEQAYCDGVKNNSWPDYHGNYAEVCK